MVRKNRTECISTAKENNLVYSFCIKYSLTMVHSSVNLPYLIKTYSNGTGGLNKMYHLFGSYRPMIREKKWYWPLVLNVVNLSDVADWKLHCPVTSKFCFTYLFSVCKSKSVRKLIAMLTIIPLTKNHCPVFALVICFPISFIIISVVPFINLADEQVRFCLTVPTVFTLCFKQSTKSW